MKRILAGLLFCLPAAIFANGDEPVNYDDPNLARTDYSDTGRFEAQLDLSAPEDQAIRTLELAQKLSNTYNAAGASAEPRYPSSAKPSSGPVD